MVALTFCLTAVRIAGWKLKEGIVDHEDYLLIGGGSIVEPKCFKQAGFNFVLQRQRSNRLHLHITAKSDEHVTHHVDCFGLDRADAVSASDCCIGDDSTFYHFLHLAR